MKIVHIVPGSGGTFYCQNCLRDNALVKAQRAQGHDVVMVPLYLPMFADEPGMSGEAPVFYGAISLYLRQQIPFLRKSPRWLTRWLDAGVFLKWAARKAGSTRARGLEEMTLSMLRGEAGGQAEELDRLVAWLTQHEKPAVVHFSNALLLGLARRVKQALGAAVVCSLQDEDTWIDAMRPEAARRVWDAITERAADVDRFLSVSQYYAEKIQRLTKIDGGRMQVIPLGIDLTDCAPAPVWPDPPVIGFLSRLSPALGLGVLVEAFLTLKQSPCWKNLKLRATGGQTGDDTAFISQLRRKLMAAGCVESAEFLPEFDRPKRLEFLRSLSVLSVPVPAGEAFGSYLLEANAAGVPVVQPNLGAFPEILHATGGGILYDPSRSEALAEALASLLGNPDHARKLGEQGRRSVQARFGIDQMAREVVRVYENLS